MPGGPHAPAQPVLLPHVRLDSPARDEMGTTVRLFWTKSHRQAFAITIIAIVALLVAACGTDSDGVAAGGSSSASQDLTGSRKIEPERVLTLDDFKAIGFKKDKTYDVSELPGAEAAHFGFWGVDPYDREEFEFRIYASQAEAIELGTERAIQRTGKTALLTKDTAIWQEGIKDARKCEGIDGSTQWAATCTVPKYYDYMFVGNIILFCPGTALDVAQENCDELLEQMQ